jgi:hypothetical protein
MKYHGEIPLSNEYTLKKNEGQECKTGPMGEGARVEKGRVSEGQYGCCTLYAYMKIEQ